MPGDVTASPGRFSYHGVYRRGGPLSLPSPSLTVPTLTNDQVGIGTGGFIIGANTPFGLTVIEGIGRPDIRSGNTDRPRMRGAFPGLNLPKTRLLTATLDIGPLLGGFGSFGTFAGAAMALGAALTSNDEYPIWIQIPGFPLVATQARVVQKIDPKYDYTADRGLLRSVPVQWEATDPYFYSAPTISTTVGLPTPGIGSTFPITFNWSFGGGSSANMATIANAGNVACWPVLVITGPCVNPTVSNLSVTGNPTLQFAISLNAGDQLVVDCDMGTIVFFPSGSTVGSPQPQILQPNSTFFAIPGGGSSVLAFNSGDTSPAAGTLTVWSANAYDSLLG
jgi:hypothetical protein